MRKGVQTGHRFSPKQRECRDCETPHHAAKLRAGARGQEDECGPSPWTVRDFQRWLCPRERVSCTAQARECKAQENLLMKEEKAFNAGSREMKNYVIVETNQGIVEGGHCRRLGIEHV